MARGGSGHGGGGHGGGGHGGHGRGGDFHGGRWGWGGWGWPYWGWGGGPYYGAYNWPVLSLMDGDDDAVYVGKDDDHDRDREHHDREHEGRGEYGRDRARGEWWRQPPSWWRGTYPQWQQLPAWQQQQWWQYQSYYQQPQYQQPYYQTYYQQPYYQQAYYTPEQLREKAVHYEQAGYRWVPGYAGSPGHWERPRAPHITIRRTPAYGQRWW